MTGAGTSTVHITVTPSTAQEIRVGGALIIALFNLTGRQRYIVIQRHMRGRRLADIGAEIGLSRQAVSLAEQAALAKLRRSLAYVREEMAA